MIPLAGEKKQLNFSKGDLPYGFSPLSQEACVVPIKEELHSSQSEENKSNSSQPNTSLNLFQSANRLFMTIMYYIGLLIIMVVLLYRGCQYIINIHFLYPSPLLETSSLTISNLNISDSNLVGIWDVNITFGHSMDDYAEVTYYNIVASSIYYKQENNAHHASNNLLAKANAMAFNVLEKEHARVHLEFKNTGFKAGQPGFEDEVIEEIKKELANGVLNFSLEIVVQAEFEKLGKIWSSLDSNYRIGRYCWDLTAGIDKVTRKGRLIDAMAVFCD
ncbi:hypothetical protein COLO4_09298 [Corchorus olitorius]|uniref:Late embryogenesis abundant protein LEA-2 subgroup domain-containing protein n=1 Tax=Corchorus olitorius TaxID=93759 RepID=A0A1R3KCI6_9ROSI|nr:hypothetical protein COLO4_09298 [Corchorus olitorius]